MGTGRTLFLTCLVVLVACLLWWLNDVKVPEPIPEKFKVKVINAGKRVFKNMLRLTEAVGLSMTMKVKRSVGNVWLSTLVTGWPWWRYQGSGLVVTDMMMGGVSVRMYEPTNTMHETLRPVVIYFHGGAFVWLSVDVYEQFTSQLAEEAGVVIISVEYRLAPEHPYPSPRDDCETVVSHILREGVAMGLDTHRVAVAGDSAGGNLAASIALQFQNRLRLQILLVPALQPIDTMTSSNIENAPYMSDSTNDRNTFMAYLLYAGYSLELLPFVKNNDHVSPEVKAEFFHSKLNHNSLIPSDVVRTPELRHQQKDVSFGNITVWNTVKDIFTDPLFAPLLAEDDSLKKVCRSYIVTCGYDIIRDDGVMYHHRLHRNGISGEWMHYKEAFHDSLMFHAGPLRLEVGVRVLRDIVVYLREHL